MRNESSTETNDQRGRSDFMLINPTSDVEAQNNHQFMKISENANAKVEPTDSGKLVSSKATK